MLLFMHQKNNKEKITVFDVGARGGFRLLKKLHSKINVYFFEPEPKSFDDLKNICLKNKSFASIHLYNTALSDSINVVSLYRTAHLDMCSLLEPDSKQFEKEYGHVKNSKPWFQSLLLTDAITVQTNTIDNFCKENNIDFIDFLKIDTQGNELAVLKGAAKMLDNKKIGVIKAEANFATMYKKQSYFKDVDAYLKSKGYLFLKLMYPNSHKSFLKRMFFKNTPQNSPSADALYVLSNEDKQKMSNERREVLASVLRELK